MGIGQLGQTITVVNKSGKVVSTSKHLVNVFKEAKSAYRERKAEIKAGRNADFEEKKARHALKAATIYDDDTHSRDYSRENRDAQRMMSGRRERPPVAERGYSDSFYANDKPRPYKSQPASPLRYDSDLERGAQRNELSRRHTEGDSRQLVKRKPARSASESDIDMDLAYGELPPPLPVRRMDDQTELREQMTKLQQLLDEANCLRYSATAIIENLQKNPDALAAVALTLAEISNIASKMAPGVLTAMKGSFPAVIALLASPQFMIAAGVGVGVTIIAFGGYKIIKKIKERKEAERGSPLEMDELQEINGDLSRIESWRRGIAETEASSLGTSVDGEFITPEASRQLMDAGVLRADDLKSTKSRKGKKEKKTSMPKTLRAPKSSREEKEKKKQPSGLRMLFKKSEHA
ncbi:hypothetical protein B0A49_08338 [Cryomyces minteri]|uniref:Uncharacterized protein n=1 Tax=Cryomyces minteri TaxID=331657 RepID=A0A4U0WG58_9PEZI|nr:hypothetical protein B0A49_08338 [Cryomyces minteri]